MNLNQFIEKVRELGVELSETQINQFNRFYELLIEYNKVMNLTGITEYEQVLEKHFYDSLTAANKVDFSNSTLVDVGAGAGFPCIPLKIAFPSLKINVVDSLNKRMKFLDVVIKELDLKDIYCFSMRGEDFAKLHREEFDYVTARAVARLNILNEICLPMVKENGYFIALKGSDGLIEIEECGNAFDKLGAKVEAVDEFYLPSENSKRINVFIKKLKKTNHLFITLLSTILVWFIATLTFVTLMLIPATSSYDNWLAFIIALPTFFIVLTVFACLWYKNVLRCISVSGIVWGVVITLQIILYLNHLKNNSLIYIIAGVFQILVILWFIMVDYQKKSKIK